MAHDLAVVQATSTRIGGTHTRNRKITNWATCEVCPVERRQTCTAVCPEMERYLGANGRTITHNSPTQKQARQTVEAMTGEQGEQGRSLSSIRRDNPHITITDTAESALIAHQAERESEARALLLIDDFCNTASKGKARTKSIFESAIILYCLERFSMPRVAEILSERFPEFGGYKECVRKTGAKAGTVVRTSANAYKIRRIVQSFERYMADRRCHHVSKNGVAN